MPKNILIERVLKTIRNYDMLRAGDTVLVAVSGGPDSVFLLHALNDLKRKLRLKKIAVCNLDHGLRGKESKEDSLFVKSLSEQLGLEFIHKKIDLNKRLLRRRFAPPRNDDKRKDLSTEELAREERYKFFRAAAKSFGANVIATGHTLDDQAETVLMRIIKGTSLKGIVGVPPVRREDIFSIVRPLIELEKKEIAGYLDDKEMAYRIDSTNIEPVYFRNIVRSRIIPFLEKYNPRLKKVLFTLAEHLREDFEFIEEEKALSRKHIWQRPKGEVEIWLKDIAIQPKALQKEILRDAFGKAGGEIKRLSFKHWKEMDNLIKFKRKGNSVDLPGSVRITRTGRTLLFRKIYNLGLSHRPRHIAD